MALLAGPILRGVFRGGGATGRGRGALRGPLVGLAVAAYLPSVSCFELQGFQWWGYQEANFSSQEEKRSGAAETETTGSSAPWAAATAAVSWASAGLNGLLEVYGLRDPEPVPEEAPALASATNSSGSDSSSSWWPWRGTGSYEEYFGPRWFTLREENGPAVHRGGLVWLDH